VRCADSISDPLVERDLRGSRSPLGRDREASRSRRALLSSAPALRRRSCFSCTAKREDLRGFPGRAPSRPRPGALERELLVLALGPSDALRLSRSMPFWIGEALLFIDWTTVCRTRWRSPPLCVVGEDLIWTPTSPSAAHEVRATGPRAAPRSEEWVSIGPQRTTASPRAGGGTCGSAGRRLGSGGSSPPQGRSSGARRPRRRRTRGEGRNEARRQPEDPQRHVSPDFKRMRRYSHRIRASRRTV